MVKKLVVLLIVLFIMEGNAMGSIVDGLMFSNKKYASSIDVKTYVVSENKLAEVLSSHWEQKLTQETHRELYGKTTYFVACVKNNGRLAAWGLLGCRVNGNNFKVYIHTVPFNKWFAYIVPLGEFTSKKNETTPIIEINWENLYTK